VGESGKEHLFIQERAGFCGSGFCSSYKLLNKIVSFALVYPCIEEHCSMKRDSLVLRLPHTHLFRPNPVPRLVRFASFNNETTHRLVRSFEFCNDEERFARELLRNKSQLWLYRCNQRKFCGDFVVINMSDPRPEHRQAWVLDLKFGADLCIGGGGAGIQLRNGHQALLEIAQNPSVLSDQILPTYVTGDRRMILQFFGVSLLN
jgi:hypothetical protein